jgi:RNA polymerase sigma factor (sigma-70 family)
VKPKSEYGRIYLWQISTATRERLENGRKYGSFYASRPSRIVAQGILKKIAAGDKAAVEECLKKYGGLVWSLARRLLRNSDDAEDAVQEIFLEVWKNAAKFDEAQSSETTFIAMIARRRLIDRIRFSSRRISADALDEVMTEPVDRADRKMQTSLEANDAVKALNALRPEQRQVLQLSIVQGLSHQEIANQTGMPLGTVKTHARRGILQAREFLGLGNLDSSKEVHA